MAEQLEGTIERITYQAEDSGYTVARLKPAAGGELVAVVGPLVGVQPGETVRLEGEWTTHAQYGRQFRFHHYTTLYPVTADGIRRYLGSGLIKGIGPVTAERIVRHFGVATLELIEREPGRLGEVPGIGPKRVAMIQKGWEAQRQIKDVMLFLQSHGVGTGFAVKIFKHYGQEAIDLVRANPYRLERDIWGIGFLTADRIARHLGVQEDDPERVAAGLRYVLNQAVEEGHAYLPAPELAEQAGQVLGVAADLVPAGLSKLVREAGAVVEDDRVYLPPLHQAEAGIAASLREFLAAPLETPPEGLDPAIAQLEGRLGLHYEEAQKAAIRAALANRLMVLTGGPGTGKTTITRGIIQLFEAAGLAVLLCSPTGRAAKKLAEATGRQASTIHRLLGYRPGVGFERDQNRPLPAHVLIVDEVSMVDLVLMHQLLKAVPRTARLVLVGDVDQLPSVGPGAVLHDMIECGVLPVVRLTHIFRQAQESQIITNAHRINEGEFPQLDNRQARDFFFVEEEDPARVAAAVRDLCAHRLPRRYGYDPVEDIQVLTAMYRGETGATQLNQMLQEALNPSGEPWDRGGRQFRVGDKVMQVRNNYDKGVFNGDIGRICAVDLEEQIAVVRFEEEVAYEFGELDELVLAYAVSVHKAQGSEYRAVVMPVTTQHYVMLQRHLLYTAVTRARELVVLVGTTKAVAIAVRNARPASRHTHLAVRLQQELREIGC